MGQEMRRFILWTVEVVAQLDPMPVSQDPQFGILQLHVNHLEELIRGALQIPPQVQVAPDYFSPTNGSWPGLTQGV